MEEEIESLLDEIAEQCQIIDSAQISLRFALTQISQFSEEEVDQELIENAKAYL